MFELLKRLSEASAPSGYESPVAEIIKSELELLGIKHVTLPDGSVIGIIRCGKSDAKRVMLQAHMDEVGFMVKSHHKDGYLSLAPLGITDTSLLTGRRVIIHGEKPFFGYIGAVPVHLSKGKNIPDYSDIYVDIGTASGVYSENLVPLGSFGSFYTEFTSFGEDDTFIKGKALSSRIPCAVILEAVRSLFNISAKLSCDTYVSFTARGKLALCSAGAVYRRINADAVISIVGTDSGDTPFKANPYCILGSGVVIPTTEEKYTYDTYVTDCLKKAASKDDILICDAPPIPKDKDTDYDLLRMKNAGAHLGAVRIPVRYKNTSSEVASKEDVTSAVKLLQNAMMDICK